MHTVTSGERKPKFHVVFFVRRFAAKADGALGELCCGLSQRVYSLSLAHATWGAASRFWLADEGTGLPFKTRQAPTVVDALSTTGTSTGPFPLAQPRLSIEEIARLPDVSSRTPAVRAHTFPRVAKLATQCHRQSVNFSG